MDTPINNSKSLKLTHNGETCSKNNGENSGSLTCGVSEEVGMVCYNRVPHTLNQSAFNWLQASRPRHSQVKLWIWRVADKWSSTKASQAKSVHADKVILTNSTNLHSIGCKHQFTSRSKSTEHSLLFMLVEMNSQHDAFFFDQSITSKMNQFWN